MPIFKIESVKDVEGYLKMQPKYKGKRLKDGEWVEGYYILLHKTTFCFVTDGDKSNEIHRIVNERMTDWGLPNVYNMSDVIPETVSMSTGMREKGKVGTIIYENDIIKHTYRGKEVISPIIYQDGAFWVKFKENELKLLIWCLQHGTVEVIGNIFDNEDLLGMKEE